MSVLTGGCPQINAVFTPRPTCGSLAQENAPLVLHVSNISAWDALAFVSVLPDPAGHSPGSAFLGWAMICRSNTSTFCVNAFHVSLRKNLSFVALYFCNLSSSVYFKSLLQITPEFSINHPQTLLYTFSHGTFIPCESIK